MDWYVTCLLTVAASTLLAAYIFLSWLYDLEVPHPSIVVDDLKALRLMLLILRTGAGALTQMLVDRDGEQAP